MELCYLAAVYTNLLITKQPLDVYFKPYPQGFKDRILRVSPDILPPGSVQHRAAWRSTASRTTISTPTRSFVRLPETNERVKVKVTHRARPRGNR